MANETTSTPVAAQTPAAAQAPAATAAPVAQPSAHAEEGAAHHEAQTYNPKMPEPQIINGVKVYPTSYVPARAELHLPKPMMAEMKEWHIEAVHVVVFFLVLFFLFIGPWKRPDQR